jgi:predicted transcriptional regulator
VSTETAAASAEGSVLRDVAEDELEQVELIMEDISDEISDLEVNLINFLLFYFFPFFNSFNFVFRL